MHGPVADCGPCAVKQCCNVYYEHNAEGINILSSQSLFVDYFNFNLFNKLLILKNCPSKLLWTSSIALCCI
jgi:hypothetical protein